MFSWDKKTKKKVHKMANPWPWLTATLVVGIFSMGIYMFEGLVNLTDTKNLKEVLGEDLKKYSLVSQEYDTMNKHFSFIIAGPKTHWLYRVELDVPETKLSDTLTAVKELGLSVNYDRSLWVLLQYRPQKVILVLGAFLGFLGFLCFMLRNLLETKQYSASVQRYQPATHQHGGGGSAENVEETEKPLTFEDVAGIDEVRDQIEEICNLFKDSSKIMAMGGKIPRGVLLNGPPGTGKTLLAKVTASECNANFLAASGSEFVEMYVGVGARRVRDLFQKARAMAPCIVFIDEIDAVAGRRGVDNNSEREQTINQLLTEMDGFDSTDNILVIAATNQIEKLDPAILRPGRFDRQVMVHLPDINGREKILNIYLGKTKYDADVVSRDLAKITAGFSGADLANLVNEAILYAARHHKEEINFKDLVWAKDKITMGSVRKVEVSSQDREQTAYHEIGHALVAKKLGVGIVSSISIIPRGKALGVTQMEQVDVLTLTKQQAIHQIAMMMGGRCAEKLFFNHLSTGAVNDLQRAHGLARSVIVTWGMSDLGPLAADDHQYRFLSEDTKRHLDLEIIQMVTAGEQLATDILTEHKKAVKKMSKVLLDKENLSALDFAQLSKNIK